MAASARLTWAAGVIARQPGERVLEVGCGHGVLVALLAEVAGEVLGIDRSPTMIAAAGRRNRAAFEAGRVRLQAALLHHADLDPHPFHAVVSFDVPAFLRPRAGGDVGRRLPGPRARRPVVVAFPVTTQGAEDDVVATVTRLAGDRGLAFSAVHRGRTAPIDSTAVVLRRPAAG